MSAETPSPPPGPAEVILFTDGAARGNPGPAGLGIVITDPQGRTLKTHCRYIGKATNNEAEYRALILGLETALQLGARIVHVRLDSELIARQLQGQYKVKAGNLLALYHQAQTLLRRFEQTTITHVPRHLNRRADQMANQAIDEAKK